MRISIIGTGYVGLVTGVCFADLGYDVTCVDTDAAKIKLLESGQSPIYEPGLPEMIARNAAAGRLHFTTDLAAGVKEAEAVFLAVGTPPSEHDGQPDLSQLRSAIAPVARAVQEGAVIVIKSTVPVGTTRSMAVQVASFRANTKISLASNPEFLRQGSAIKDFMNPDRIVIGVSDLRAREVLSRLYEPLTQGEAPMLVTTFESSEMIKYAANTMLAAKIAFINEIADISERVGANIRDVARGVGLDPRIGDQFLQAGPGFGGSCFPKDTLALKAVANAHKLITPLVDGVVSSNLQRKMRMMEKIIGACGGDVKGKTISILGLTFKPGTDDMRESVSLYLLPALLERGAKIRAYDPQGMKRAAQEIRGNVTYCTDAYDAGKGADACVLLTEWNEFKSLELPRLAKSMKEALMIDLRNLYKRRSMAQAGFRYVSIGRAEVSPEKPEVTDMVPLKEEAA